MLKKKQYMFEFRTGTEINKLSLFEHSAILSSHDIIALLRRKKLSWFASLQLVVEVRSSANIKVRNVKIKK